MAFGSLKTDTLENIYRVEHIQHNSSLSLHEVIDNAGANLASMIFWMFMYKCLITHSLDHKKSADLTSGEEEDSNTNHF